MAELLARARQLLAAGPYDARPAEVAAMHAAIYPERDAVCETCRGELGRAYYAIQRWAEQQGAAGATPFISSTTMQKTTVARLKEGLLHTPHGLGVTYSNDNLTDSAARAILKADPDAARLFDVLPPAASGSPDPDSDASDNSTDTASTPAPASEPQIDYDLLADKVAERLRAGMKAEPTATPQPAQPVGIDGQPVAPNSDPNGEKLSVDGDHLGEADDHSDDSTRPVRLSRMNKEQLIAAYTAELGQAPAPDLTNDDLREAIAAKREGSTAQA